MVADYYDNYERMNDESQNYNWRSGNPTVNLSHKILK